MAIVKAITHEDSNVHFRLTCSFVNELHIDQSVSHNGVCLTVVEKDADSYVVTAMHETLMRTNLGMLKVGDAVNVERSMCMNGRLDGHIVQGHVDTTAQCTAIADADGSKYFTFQIEERQEDGSPLDATYDEKRLADAINERRRKGYITVDKGSVTVNGVSLTVCNPTEQTFEVAIIPYTMTHTNFGTIEVGTVVNLEFDILGKYIANLLPK